MAPLTYSSNVNLFQAALEIVARSNGTSCHLGKAPIKLFLMTLSYTADPTHLPPGFKTLRKINHVFLLPNFKRKLVLKITLNVKKNVKQKHPRQV